MPLKNIRDIFSEPTTTNFTLATDATHSLKKLTNVSRHERQSERNEW